MEPYITPKACYKKVSMRVLSREERAEMSRLVAADIRLLVDTAAAEEKQSS